MQWRSLVILALATRSHALIRFGCSQLVVDRLDPLVNPAVVPSPHVHQIIGGVSAPLCVRTIVELTNVIRIRSCLA